MRAGGREAVPAGRTLLGRQQRLGVGRGGLLCRGHSTGKGREVWRSLSSKPKGNPGLRQEERPGSRQTTKGFFKAEEGYVGSSRAREHCTRSPEGLFRLSVSRLTGWVVVPL